METTNETVEERIVEESIVVNAPNSPLYWVRLIDSLNGKPVVYVLKCTDEDLDICASEKAYNPYRILKQLARRLNLLEINCPNEEQLWRDIYDEMIRVLELKECIDEKIDEIISGYDYKTLRLITINEKGGIVRLYTNFTRS